jgi:hypothetical protein
MFGHARSYTVKNILLTLQRLFCRQEKQLMNMTYVRGKHSIIVSLYLKKLVESCPRPWDGQTSPAYPSNPVQYLCISCYVIANKLVLSYLLFRLLPQTRCLFIGPLFTLNYMQFMCKNSSWF